MLPNGLTLLVQEDRSAPVVAVVTHVKAGFFDEPDRWTGISHVLEHMFFKGTPRRGVGAIARETKSAGGYLNASTTYDHTSVLHRPPGVRPCRRRSTSRPTRSATPSIDADELARELQVIIQEAKRKLDTPSAVAYETLHEVMFDRHRIRRWRIGHEAQLAGFTRADVHGYYALAIRAGADHRGHRRRRGAGPRRSRCAREAYGRLAGGPRRGGSLAGGAASAARCGRAPCAAT